MRTIQTSLSDITGLGYNAETLFSLLDTNLECDSLRVSQPNVQRGINVCDAITIICRESVVFIGH